MQLFLPTANERLSPTGTDPVWLDTIRPQDQEFLKNSIHNRPDSRVVCSRLNSEPPWHSPHTSQVPTVIHTFFMREWLCLFQAVPEGNARLIFKCSIIASPWYFFTEIGLPRGSCWNSGLLLEARSKPRKMWVNWRAHRLIEISRADVLSR